MARATTKQSGPEPLLLCGCGMLRREIERLAQQNGWKLESRLCPPHPCLDWPALATSLRGQLQAGRRTVVIFGQCHPAMDALVDAGRAVRTGGLNCFQMVLGRERYDEEISAGAYFLFEDLVEDWENTLQRLFGAHRQATRELFCCCHKYLLAIRTPCSADYRTRAEAAAAAVGLPLRWLDAPLDHLQEVIETAIADACRETACPPA